MEDGERKEEQKGERARERKKKSERKGEASKQARSAREVPRFTHVQVPSATMEFRSRFDRGGGGKLWQIGSDHYYE